MNLKTGGVPFPSLFASMHSQHIELAKSIQAKINQRSILTHLHAHQELYQESQYPDVGPPLPSGGNDGKCSPSRPHTTLVSLFSVRYMLAQSAWPSLRIVFETVSPRKKFHTLSHVCTRCQSPIDESAETVGSGHACTCVIIPSRYPSTCSQDSSQEVSAGFCLDSWLS